MFHTSSKKMAASDLPTSGSSSLTRGSEGSGFVEVDAQQPSATFPTGSSQEVPAKTQDAHWIAGAIANSGQFLKSIEDHFATFATLISMVGYVIIAAFADNGMSLACFLLYVIFLCFLYLAHSSISAPTAIKEGFRTLNRIFMVGFFILLAIVLVQNWQLFSQGFDAAKKYLAPVQQESVQNPVPSNSQSSASSQG